MVTHLSDEWLSELDRVARADERLRAATKGVHLILEQVVLPTRDAVTASDPAAVDGAVVWQVVIDDGDVRFHPGRVGDPTVRFTTDLVTARAVATGAESTQQAFVAGRLRVGGDATAIVEHHAVLEGLGDVFASVSVDD